MEDVVEIIGWVMWGLAILFAVSIILGILFGLVRGGKRTFIRMITIIIGLVAALLLTPVFSGMLLGIPIPGVGKSAVDLAKDFLLENETGAAIAGHEHGEELMNLAQSCAAGLVSYAAVFFILFFVFNALSWIVYAILAATLAPKKVRNADGEKERVRIGRLSGLGLGVVTGIICFAFFTVPVTGAMQTLDAAAKYTPAFASYTDEDTQNIEGVGESFAMLNDYVNEINGAVQNHKSFVGQITKYTGLQALGGLGTEYLLNVKSDGQRFNLKKDIINLAHTAKDVVAVYAAENESGTTFTDKLLTWNAAEFAELENIFDKLFDIGFIRIAFEYTDVIIDVFDVGDMLNDVDIFANDPELKENTLTAIRAVTNPSDLQLIADALVDVAGTIFVRENSAVGTSIYETKSMVQKIEKFETSSSVDTVVNVLNRLTNSQDIGKPMRALLLGFLNNIKEELNNDIGGIELGKVIDELKIKLEPNGTGIIEPIDWQSEMASIFGIVKFMAYLNETDGVLDAAILQSLLDSLGSSILADAMVELLSDVIEEGTGIKFTLAPGTAGAFLGIIGNTAGTLINLFDSENAGEGMDIENPNELLDVFGGVEVIESLVALNKDEQAVTIDLNGLIGDTGNDLDSDAVRNAVETMLADNESDLDADDVMKLFGLI